MNTTLPQAAQAENFPSTQAYPQPIPSVIMAMPAAAAIQATLQLFDVGAIGADTAESWLLLLETSNS
jgi:hypothetical protein